ncbi:MAG TPA: helix-turn-helix domain-containing protein [Marmoricola sp.]|nr:helix-turn-helix domain-containing protein [Marmoricola sp.]
MAAELERVPDPGFDEGAGQGVPSDAGPSELVVRRNAALSGAVGVAASAMAIAYVWRASSGGALWDWLIFAVMAVVGAAQLAALVDARTPLLLADSLGVRVRLGKEWRGLPWSALDQVVVERRESMLRDGRLVLSPRDLAGALDGLDRGARRQVTRTQRWYGAPLAVPLAVTTRVNTDRLVDDLAELAAGRTDVVLLRGKELANLDAPRSPADGPDRAAERVAQQEPEDRPERDTVDGAPEGPTADASPDTPGEQPRPRVIGGLGTLVSRVGKGRHHDVDVAARDDRAAGRATDSDGSAAEQHVPAPSVIAPLREPRRALRAELTREAPVTEPATSSDPQERELRRRGAVDLVFDDVELSGNVRPIVRVGDPVSPPVIDDFVTQPALDPVIGPEITAARTRAGLSVDRLSERTRIRPHVIECIEVDDFAPCGGDFYARGHLRTLARFLGLDAEQLLRQYDERYAHAPINARRVFEAELATGMNGGMRATFGGPRWSLLVGAVMCLLMVWGVARFFTDSPERLVSPSPEISVSAGLTSHQQPAGSPVAVTRRVTVTAHGTVSTVVVRDRTGEILWSGRLRAGHHRGMAGLPPFKVKASHGAAVVVAVGKHRLGAVGAGNGPATRTVGGR